MDLALTTSASEVVCVIDWLEARGAVFRHLAAGRTVGRIEGRAVIVATPERLRELREGYELRDVDRHDLRVLAALAGAEAPGQLGSCTERPS